MRWPSLSAFSSSSAPSSSVTSPKPADDEAAFQKHHGNKKHGQNLRSNTFGFRFNSSPDAAPKLTRQRKLRHLTDKDVASSDGVPASSKSSPPEPLKLSRSHSTSSSPPRISTKAPTSPVPLPVPLPLPQKLRGENLHAAGEADSRLRSPKEKEHDSSRERSNGGGIGTSLSTSAPCSTGNNHSVLVGRETKKTAEQQHQEPRSSTATVAGLDLNNFRHDKAAKSTSMSPYASPEISPQRISHAFITSPYHNLIPNGKQGWSAPEMSSLDIPGLPPPAYFDLSSDSSPLQSPAPNGSPPSPVTARTSFETSAARPRDSNAGVEVHKLPLPPGANLLISPTLTPAAAAVVPPVAPAATAAKQEYVPMKSQWQKGKLIGRGTFGSVFVATNRETGALCAMKEVDMFPDDPKSQECIKQLEQEIKVLSQLKHPNIVQYYGSEIVEDHFYIYLEYVHPGSINKYVRDHCGAVTESIVRSFTRHILSGLAYLHTMKTVHRDIKGANLLVDAFGVVKLADFGMSKHLTGQVAELSMKGSPYWMAPELMQAVIQKDHNSDLALAVDIWSLGCTIIEMFTGKPPWSEFEGAAAMFKVMRDTPPIPETLSADGKDFLLWCFKRNPAERPSASLLLEHRWLKQLHDALPSSTPQINGTKPMDTSRSLRVTDDKTSRAGPMIPQLPTSRSSKGKFISENSPMLNTRAVQQERPMIS
ncbi:unnamed protein product [Linum tenue]|uniref:mitogen-activated protein kinase kinase kinase n=1 Tax=Linum tenue TaxID=586396 RepID=A0AAV0R992_9ROSI|nr:unnamed protein product [Linum tenue]